MSSGWIALVLAITSIAILWRMRLSNCLITALWLWSLSSARAYIWHRRSIHFHGACPHFGTAHRHGFRRIVAIEAIPPHRDLGTLRNMLVVFRAGYRVWEFRLVRVHRVTTLAAAVEAAFGSATAQKLHIQLDKTN